KDKLSAMVLDSPAAAELQKEVKGLKQLDEVLGKNDYAIGFPKTEKGAALRDQIDEFIEKKEKDGSLKKLQEVWFGQDESIKKIQPLPPSSPKGTIRMVTDSLTPPFSYIKEGRTVGFDIALVSEFCIEYGYALSITSLDFSAILPALHSASFDMAAGGMSVTSERKESIYFSRPLYEGKSVILVKDGAKSASLENGDKGKVQNSAFVPEQFKNVTLKYNSISEMDKDGLVLGMHTGFVMVDKLTRQMLPKAKIEYYKTTADMAYLVSSGKIDGFVNDEPIIRYVSLEIPDLGYIDFDGKSLPMIACFPKNEKGRLLRDEFNSYIKKCKTDGRLKAIDDLWLSKDEEKKVVDLGNFDAKKGVIRLGTTADTPPFEYMKDGKIVGYEIDLVARFCREAGYGLEIQDVPFDSLIMGLQSGMYDMVASCLSDTPAHRESTNISEPIYDSRLVMAVQILDHKKSKALSHGGEKTGELKYHSFDELNLNGKKIGVQTGSAFDEMAATFFPKAEVEYFNSTTDMAKLLSMGKLDAMIADEPAAQSLSVSVENIDYIRDYLEPANFSAAFQKNKDGEKLRDEMNAFLTKAMSDGSLKKLQQIWFGSDESKKVVDYSSLPATNGTLKLATSAEYPPFEYLQNNKIVGYDIACAASFCKEYGYALKISDMNFDALLPALVSGACDFAIAGISVTEERSKSVNFSIPTYDGGVVVLVQKKLEKNAPKTKYTSADELKVPGKKMGVQIGDVKIDDYVSKYFPLAEKKYSNSIPELIQMLATNKIDAFLMDEPIMRYIQKEYNNFALLPFDVPPVGYSFGFAKSEKGRKLNDQLNQFVKKLKADGRLGEIYEAWFGDDEKRKTIDYSDLTGVNGTITLALEGVNPPFTYMKEDTIVGSNMEIVKLFCKEYGYDMKADIMNYDAIFPAIKSGKYDMCTELISTAERAEEMIFSIPTYDAYCSLVVALENPEKPSKFSEMIESLAASFEKTFVREGRWRLVLYGTGITILISIFSALFGTLLGFIICGLRLSRKCIADGVAVIYIRIMQGLPMVVFLMILYYIVFAKSELSGIWVAVIGFGMNFGAYVSEMIRTGILAVDKGQMEAALALGYPKAKAFLKMVLP
ncbi:MAG: ABC transporter permease subunit, partial [Treponema sp.]|nr:ABC transporter permease subunit [Treponema sp.]